MLSSKPCLVPNGGGSGGAVGRDGSSKPGLCHNCGKPGHWSRKCPNKKRDGSGGGGGRGRGAGGGRGGDGRAAGRGNGGGNNQRSWRSTAPSPGSDHTKTYNGKAFHWCAKCNRWTTTHTTATHKKKAEADASPAANSHFFRIPRLATLALDLPLCRKIFGIFSECIFLDSSLVSP